MLYFCTYTHSYTYVTHTNMCRNVNSSINSSSKQTLYICIYTYSYTYIRRERLVMAWCMNVDRKRIHAYIHTYTHTNMCRNVNANGQKVLYQGPPEQHTPNVSTCMCIWYVYVYACVCTSMWKWSCFYTKVHSSSTLPT
jgi:hypothetical protein